MKRCESKKYKTQVRVLYKNSEIIGVFNNKKEAQNFFELNIGPLPDKRKNVFYYEGNRYHIMYDWM